MAAILSLADIIELTEEIKAFNARDYVVRDADGREIFDLKAMRDSGKALPIQEYTFESGDFNDFQNKLVEIKFSNGQKVAFNRDSGWYEIVSVNQGDVYIITNGVGLYKIGVSTNPKKRLKQLQTSSAYKLSILKVYHCNDMLKAESDLHEAYNTKRQEGEWFKLDMSDLRAIDDYFALPHESSD